MDLRGIKARRAVSLGSRFFGRDPAGHEIGFTGDCMTLDGKPFFAVCGEMHFCRVAADQWADSVRKMKAGGVDVLTTYVFWIVHEEEEGVFRFDGQRDLRRFLACCKREGMRVILRIGPFAHGEMRNGGLPDWLYGKPFAVRGNDPAYLSCVGRWYRAVSEQADGFLFGQGGPVIGVQLENEYMHSAAPWAFSAETTNEWVPGGDGGEAHIRLLAGLAREAGFRVPFFTATAWGGAMAPADETLPLWGGYAYRPWLFYGQGGVHPATEEYDYRNCHSDAVPACYNFAPRYRPESVPYACCEMMGGMFCSYHYRFRLPFESVDALANVQIGSGCTMLGYYMYRGGTTPTGKSVPFLNEGQVPQRSYDFQAPVGEYGQIRPSWRRLRTLHMFCRTFSELLCRSSTALPEGEGARDPEDTERLRWCVRSDGDSGFLFLMNFQDHVRMPARQGIRIGLTLPGETVRFGPLSLAPDENAILPFRLRMGGALLRSADAQPIGCRRIRGEDCWFFFAPEGMKPVFRWDAATAEISGCASQCTDGEIVCAPEPGTDFRVRTARETIRIFTLSREQATRFSFLETDSGSVAVLCDTVAIPCEGGARAETAESPVRFLTYPPALPGSGELSRTLPEYDVRPAREGAFVGVELTRARRLAEPRLEETGAGRFLVSLPPTEGFKTVLLSVEYEGDVGRAYAGGELISDNFCNGAPWEIRVDGNEAIRREGRLAIVLAPKREGVTIEANTTMAGRTQRAERATAALLGLRLTAVGEAFLPLRAADSDFRKTEEKGESA